MHGGLQSVKTADDNERLPRRRLSRSRMDGHRAAHRHAEHVCAPDAERGQVVMAFVVPRKHAQPGDALWGVKQVVFADEANSTVAKIDTTSELEEAERKRRDGV